VVTPTPNWPDLYSSLQDRVTTHLNVFSSEQAAVQVAACPGWSVKDVMAHVSGLVAETLANVPLPRGSVEGTARQVSNRAEWSLSDVLSEWGSNAPAFADYADENPAYAAALASDLTVHFFDIADAVDVPVETDTETTRHVAARYAGTLQGRVAETLDVGLTVALDGDVLDAPNPNASEQLKLATTSYDFLRSVTSRRSRSQVEALDWSGDPSLILDGPWAQYGPLQD